MAGNSTLNLNVTDASNGQAVPAQVWVNQAPIGPVSQTTSVTVPSGKPSTFYAQAAGYDPSTRTVTPDPGTSNLDIPLNPTLPSTSQSGSLQVMTTNPDLSGVDVMVSGNGISRSAVTSNGVARVDDLPYGDYTLTTSYPPNYETATKTVTIDQPDQLNLVNMVSTGSGDLQGGSAALPASTDGTAPTPANALPPQPKADPAENLYSAASWDSYFTSAQCRVYIGNLFIDELQSIEYHFLSNAVPVFGYCSRLADAYGDGHALVQGQLVVNYISELYLYTALTAYAQKMVAPAVPSKDEKDAQSLSAALASRQSAPGNPAANQAIANLVQNPNAVQLVNQASKSVQPGGYDINAALQSGAVEIRIEIGTGEHRTVRKLEYVKFTGNEQIVDQSGNLIGDAYAFIARRLR